MYPHQYYHVMKQNQDKKTWRYPMVQYAFARGFKPAARHFHTGPSVVRKRNNVIKKIERRFFLHFRQRPVRL